MIFRTIGPWAAVLVSGVLVTAMPVTARLLTEPTRIAPGIDRRVDALANELAAAEQRIAVLEARIRADEEYNRQCVAGIGAALRDHRHGVMVVTAGGFLGDPRTELHYEYQATSRPYSLENDGNASGNPFRPLASVQLPGCALTAAPAVPSAVPAR